MAALVVIVDKLVTLRRAQAAQKHAPWIFMLISVVGSVLKELDVVPPTYFSNTKSLLNVYFVKVAWGWTLFLLTPFLLLYISSSGRGVTFLIRRLLALVVATAIWYICTVTFSYIEGVTGSCFQTRTLDLIHKEFTSISSCKQAGFHWHGYDISGHSFILTYSTLFILEETEPMASLKTVYLSALPRMTLSLLYAALHLIVAIWLLMFTFTSVYFHDPSHKLVGTMCGLLPWYLTYRVWYLKPLSPGLPCSAAPKEQNGC